MLEIKRDYYLRQLIAQRGSSFIKIITGLRRAGKSYLLDPIFRQFLLQDGVAPDHIIHLNLEEFENRCLLDPSALFTFVKKQIADSQTYYVLLDEIQLVPGFESILSSFLHLDNLDVYVTGSNSRFLSSDVITQFRGRGTQIHLYPLSFGEIYAALGGDKYELWERYYRYGGLPQVVQQPDDQARISFLEAQKDNVYLNDLIERYRIRNSDSLGILSSVIASDVGALTNPHKLERTFKSKIGVDLSYHKIEDYLEKLQNAFLIEKSKRFDVKGKRYIDTPVKYYFTDPGIRNAFVDFRQTEESHLMENIIYNELRRRGFKVDVGTVETRGENGTRQQLEVDFVARKADNTYYIQSALTIGDSAKRYQESRSLDHINDHFNKIIIAKDTFAPGHERNGIATIGLFGFLLDDKILDKYQ